MYKIVVMKVFRLSQSDSITHAVNAKNLNSSIKYAHTIVFDLLCIYHRDEIKNIRNYYFLE